MIRFKQKEYSFISKTLRFFRELKTVDKLPITRDEFYVMFSSNPKDDKENDRVEKVISEYYKNKNAADVLFSLAARFVSSWCSDHSISFGEFAKNPMKYKEGLDFSYDRLLKYPKRYLFDAIGAGQMGIVFDYPFNRIEKISFKGFSPAEVKFYQHQKKNPLSVFPKIYTLEKDQVVLEKVLTDTNKVNKTKKYIERYIKRSLTTKDGRGIPVSESKWNLAKKELGENHWFYKFLQEIESGLYSIYGVKTMGDLHSDNIGERIKTGELVYFDPIGETILMK